MRGPKLVAHNQMTVVGFNFHGDPFETSVGWTEENEIGRLWNRLLAYLKQHSDDIRDIRYDDVMLEIHIWDAETQVTGEFDVFVGLEVTSLDHVPVPLVVKVLPAVTYAIFTLEGEEISSDWAQAIYSGWLTENDYRSSHSYMIQWYDPRFKSLEHLEGSELDVYIPVEKT